MNEYQLDKNVCPSSLGENDEPVDINETAHRWDLESDPIECAECGAIQDISDRITEIWEEMESVIRGTGVASLIEELVRLEIKLSKEN